MKTIEETLTGVRGCRGYTFHQIERKGSLAIYQQVHQNGKTVAFEAVRIKQTAEWSINEAIIPARETYPASEEWGTNGFTFKTLEQAQRKLASMQN